MLGAVSEVVWLEDQELGGLLKLEATSLAHLDIRSRKRVGPHDCQSLLSWFRSKDRLRSGLVTS